MPVILSRSEEIDWIRASNPLSRVLPLLAAYPYDKMNAHPVADMINMAGVNDPALLNPIGEKLLKEIITAPLEQRRHHKERSFPEIPRYMSRQQFGEQKE